MSHSTNLQEELSRKNLLLNTAEQIAKFGHWQWNVPANKLTWSDNMYRIYGLEPGSRLDFETYIATIHPDDRQLVRDHVSGAFQTKAFEEYHHRIILSDGTVKVLHARGEVILDEHNEIIMMMGTGQDVTEQKNAEQELTQKSQELERINKELQEFAYIASHDLQEPLRKMTVFISMLAKEEAAAISEKGKQYMDKIVKSSSRMRSLIDDILKFSRLNSPGEFVNVNLERVVAQVLSDMEPIVIKTGATITKDALPVIQANATQMGQLFQNLLSNALKFQTNSPVINISVQTISTVQLGEAGTVPLKYKFLPDEKFCRICITDNGIGIDAGYHESIFTIFQRLNGKQYEGTGIGLAICKKITDNHRGMIHLKSAVGEGCTFVVTLPFSQESNPEEVKTRN